ncbi:NAD(P)H-binding protein [Amorphoplanes nipponensis]|uniref:NmrA family transcriptional regulator n=1 Tax=Actinoplanes nipponensis TaxID=135950 RepID=A0A919JE18_9ACTN|nr:NAD(P)H-binding protein [Actinoplanes nipponensis]GIE47852.1 NmrA family transcriptional regulator [Actinoplanes nipponensis]
MIIVTGAGGQLGGAVLAELLGHLPAEQIGVSAREPGKLAGLQQRGVRVRPGDFGDPAGLEHAFAGAATVLIVSANSTGADAVRLHSNAIAAAAAAGAKRIVYTSHMGAGPSSPFPPMPDHAATEEVLRRSGVAYTSLRNGFYASTVPLLLRAALATGELRVPEDGAIAWTTHADLAAAAARILVDEPFDGPTPPLTGPEAVDMTRVAEIAARITGRPVRRVVVPDEEYRQGLLAAGLEVPAADMLVGLFAASRRGDFGPAGPALAGLLGRPATTIEDYLLSALAAGPGR